MKKILSMILALAIACSLMVPAFAANMDVSLEPGVVEAGDTVVVTITLEEPIDVSEGATMLQGDLKYDGTVLEFQSVEKSDELSNAAKHKKQDKVVFHYLSLDNKPVGFSAGVLVTITFAAKEEVSVDVVESAMTYTAYVQNAQGKDVGDLTYDSEVSVKICKGHNFVDGQCSRCGEKEDAPVVNPFVDVPEGIYYYEPVLWAVENGITKGVDATHFAPELNVNRAQVVTFLWRANGKPEPTTTVNPFEDVIEGDFYYKAVLWAVENGITKGVDATHFGPDLDCNRAQVVTFLWRANGKPAHTAAENPFHDVFAGDFYYDAVLWAVENGITKGVSSTAFSVDGTCSRAQIVTFLYRDQSA